MGLLLFWLELTFYLLKKGKLSRSGKSDGILPGLLLYYLGSLPPTGIPICIKWITRPSPVLITVDLALGFLLFPVEFPDGVLYCYV